MPKISAIATAIQTKITGGMARPKVTPFIAARLLSQPGTSPKTLPAKAEPMLVRICVQAGGGEADAERHDQRLALQGKLKSPLSKPISRADHQDDDDGDRRGNAEAR